MRRSAAFLLRFFALAGVLFALWSFAGVGNAYARAVLAVADPLIWLLTGFHVSAITPTETGLEVFIARGADQVAVPFQPREQFSGLIPFLALLSATLGIGWRRWLRALGIGVGVLFAFHVGLMLFGPYMTGLPQGHLPLLWMRRVNTAIDIVYGFYGLVGYAALPFLLWFWLVQRATPAPAGAPRRWS